MVENLKILILEDNQSDADLLQRELKKAGFTYTSEIVQTRVAFESGLENFKPDLILADYSLPSFDGAAAFIIKQNTYPDIPFIIVSGVLGEENAVELIKNGVTDYALKDKLFVLSPKIKRALKEAEEKKEKRTADIQLALQKEDLEDQFKAIFNDAPLGIAIIDSLTGKFINVNPMFAEILGRSVEEIISIDWMSITHPDDIQSDLENMNQLLAGDTNGFRMDKRYIHSDESCIWIKMIVSQISHYDKAHPRHLCMIEDITERRRAKQNLIEQNIELVKTNTELDRFVYSVSHDLRSPLTAILGLLSFIEEESQESETLEHAEMIRNSINRLDMFIKNILNYSRNNRAILEVENIPLQKIATETVNSLYNMKEAEGINFEIDIKELQPFYSDRLRFNTVLENLISNAIKYHKNDKSDRYIKITGHSNDENLQLIIADNGTGIEPANHNKIFDMFFRLSGAADGSGIGLYIVKETVEILQGTIQIQSEKGTGTIFTITLKNLKP